MLAVCQALCWALREARLQEKNVPGGAGLALGGLGTRGVFVLTSVTEILGTALAVRGTKACLGHRGH